MKQGLFGHPPRGLGSPDINHGGQMPGGALYEVLPQSHRGNRALYPNPNQGVTDAMRRSDRELHWWYRAREQGADHWVISIRTGYQILCEQVLGLVHTK